MLFNSLEYAIFLPIVFGIYWALPHRFRWPLLLAASYYFYMSWNPKYVILILLTTIVSYGTAILIENNRSGKVRKIILTSALIICLGVLFIFKYFNFFTEAIAGVLSRFTINLHPITLQLALPVGISFYTFQTLSYVIDVYRGNVKAEKNFGIYATFISFFPQLVAGPIERTENLLPQIKREKEFDYSGAVYGLKLMAWGFFKKLAIADVVATYVDIVYSSLDRCIGFDFLMAIFFFTIQIYCDFSGYSDIAIGTARLLGINLMTNFKSPYFSTSIKEFWSRWHISLSTWFRDYVYIPLGGSRCSKIKRDRNLMITFLASGLWHGANWTYIIWGGIHGIAQVVENHLNIKRNSKVAKLIWWMIIFVFCNIAWVFFRAETIEDACYVLKAAIAELIHPALSLRNKVGLSKMEFYRIMCTILILFGVDFAAVKVDVIKWISGKNAVLRWSVYLILIWMILFFMKPAGTSEFVYFQF